MRWQFGGNLQPVRMICEFDWKECPAAIINYVWSEIVTDVVECLTNEWMIWRVIAMLFVCSVLIHTIYSKTKLIDETTINRKNLNVVGCKVQDLELKVNILTYKMQYGTWPLPRQIHGSGLGREFKNVRLTLTNSNDRNAWIKHMLLSPTENAACVPYAKIGPRSVRCLTKLINLETKYMSSKFEGDQSPISTKEKASRIGSEKSLNFDTKMSGELTSKEKTVEKSGKSENLGMRNREILETSKKSTSNCWSETQVSKYRENQKWMKNDQKKVSKKFSHADKTPEERVNATHETLHQVREKLENLHSVLRIYGQPTSEKNPTNSTNQELAESILRELKNLGNLTESETETKTQKSSNLEKFHLDNEEISKKEDNPLTESTSEFEQCHSDPDFSWSSNNENKIEFDQIYENQGKASIDETSKVCEKSGENLWKASPNFQNAEETNSSVKKVEKNVEKQISMSKSKNCEEKNILDFSESPKLQKIDKKEKKENVEWSNMEKNISNSEKIDGKWKIDEKQRIEEQNNASPISSTAEFSKDSDTDEKSNAILLREALKFKNVLMTQIELENASKSKISSKNEENDSGEFLWSKSNLHFQPKILDIISEEHSASSSTEKAIKVVPKKRGLEKSEIKKSESNSLLKAKESKSCEKLESKKSSDSLEMCSKASKILKYEKKVFSEEEKSLEEEPKDLKFLVNESVQNIRDCIEAFSQMQKEAIVETKKSLREEDDYFDEKMEISLIPEEKSSLESITCFVNKIGMTESEELPRKLSEPGILRLVDLEFENWAESSCLDVKKEDFSLRRRPGSTSLRERVKNDEKSLFESAKSLDDAEDLTSDFSGKQLNDYSSQSDFFDEKLLEKDTEEKSRWIDSPLTGRTVIRATGSCTSNVEASTSENDSVKSGEYEKTGNEIMDSKMVKKLIEIEEPTIPETSDGLFEAEVVQETSSTYFTDEASFPEEKVQLVDICDEKFELEDDRWLYEEEFSGKPEVELKSEVSVKGPEIEVKNVEEEEKFERTEDFSIHEPEVVEKDEVFHCKPEMEQKKVKKSENLEEKPETDENSRKIRVEEIKIVQESLDDEKKVENDGKTDERGSENSKNRPNSSETFVINSPRTKSRTSEIANLLNDNSTLYMDANSREFLNASGTSLRLEKGFLASSKSARGSCSSPLRQNVPWNTPRRGSSLPNSEKSKKSTEKMDKSKENSKNHENSIKNKNSKSGNPGLATKSHLNLKGTRDLESSSFGHRNVNSNVDLRERRSRSYATPRKSDSSPRNLSNSESPSIQRLSRERKTQKSIKVDLENEKNVRDRSRVDFPGKKSEKGENWSKRDEKNGQIDVEASGESSRKNSSSFPSSNDAQRAKKCEKFESASLTRSESKESPKMLKSPKSSLLLSKNLSKSSIPILRSRLEAVRQTGQEKRSKSPSRCALTMASSGWSQENRSLPIFSDFESEKLCSDGKTLAGTRNSIKIDSQGLGSVEKMADSEISKKSISPESRTVIYVNIVTEQEQKSATRIVDPKKFLEYLKDRDLKIQSVQDQKISTDKQENRAISSPRILTIVSSAVEDKMADNCPDNCRPGSWSLRVEKREIEVSAKPSVIDTSTSISDLPDDTLIRPQILPGDSKFQIFQVPKELTKDEYIVLLETLNQDPNLHQLREMHYLCNKLGLGFNE